VKVGFFQPPPALRTGGLEAAIRGLETALRGQAIEVAVDPQSLDGLNAVHFHGLWQPAHSRTGKECTAAHVPYVVSPHGMLEPWAWRHKWWKKWPYFLLRERSFLQRAAALLATSKMEAERLRVFFPAQRIEMLPLGLTADAAENYAESRRKLGWRDEECVLLFLSRIHEKKGVDLLLQALVAQHGRWRELWPRLRLVVVGSGDEEYLAQLHRFSTENARALPRIDWMGEIWGEARWRFFQGADLFCLPSHSENFGLAVLEACQVGTPVLTTTATPWAGELSSRGIITEPSVNSVSEGLSRFFTQGPRAPEERASLSKWAHEQFHWRSLAPKYERLYSSL